ncbi:MAG TPA: allantoinase [Verrucomicrobiae bacterium]|nr:allantoinase [Verrucomicrobiae bacterium]
MNEFDLIIRNGTLISPEGEKKADVAVSDGKITAISGGTAREEIDATGLHVFPGVIDSHVHFNEPGRADWEGVATGSSALAAGGGTLFFDMPLNAHPPTCDTSSFDAKRIACEDQSITDFALWGGLVPDNLHALKHLSERGVIGFKAFMSNSGIEDFQCVDNATLKQGMQRVAELGKLVAVHAESDLITTQLATKALAEDKISIRDYLNSRPIHAELEAIHRAIEMSRETKCALHIVHVSSGAGVALIASAQAQGVDVTCETCPHYLVLTEDDVEKLGAVAKCAPPLRKKPAQDVLWRYLENGFVSTVGSDHSPSPPDMKRHYNFFKVWGGISGVQHTLPLLLTEGRVNRGIALPFISDLLSANVARRFKIPNKGKIKVGFDADFALVDLKQSFAVAKEDLLYRHQQSPYIGRALTGRVVQTILRGKTIYKDGKVVSTPTGRLVKPEQ